MVDEERRNYLVGLLTAAAGVGTAACTSGGKDRDFGIQYPRESTKSTDTEEPNPTEPNHFDPTETYHKDKDKVTVTPKLEGGDDTPTREGGEDYTTPTVDDVVDSWEEAIPTGCNINNQQRHWLVSQVDTHEGLEGDNIFDYVEEGKVRFSQSNSELRMEVDPDFGPQTEYTVEEGYNIEDAC